MELFLRKKTVISLIWGFGLGLAFVYIFFFLPKKPLTDEEFTIVVLPDTQHYGKEIFSQQTQWIADNKEALNIVFVVHLGDIIDKFKSKDEWENAGASMSILDGKVPYLVVPGNHDNNSGTDSTLYNTYFPYQKFQNFSYYGGHFPETGNDNNYGFFTVGGREFLVLGLEFCPSDADLAWANTIVNAYSNKKVIYFTHTYMNYNERRVKNTDANSCGNFPNKGNDGESQWEKFVKHHKNVVLVLSGHITYDGLGKKVDMKDGYPIYQILQNYQMNKDGGGGYLRYYTFQPKKNKIIVKTYSPYTGLYKTDGQNSFKLDYPLQSCLLNGAYRCTSIGRWQCQDFRWRPAPYPTNKKLGFLHLSFYLDRVSYSSCYLYKPAYGLGKDFTYILNESYAFGKNLIYSNK